MTLVLKRVGLLALMVTVGIIMELIFNGFTPISRERLLVTISGAFLVYIGVSIYKEYKKQKLEEQAEAHR